MGDSSNLAPAAPGPLQHFVIFYSFQPAHRIRVVLQLHEGAPNTLPKVLAFLFGLSHQVWRSVHSVFPNTESNKYYQACFHSCRLIALRGRNDWSISGCVFCVQ